MSKIKINKPIFMIGMPRSGTTVLSEAISLHEALGWFSNYYNRIYSIPWIAYFDRISSGTSFAWRLRGKKSQSKSISSRLRRFLPHTDEAFNIWEECCGKKILKDYLINQTADLNEKKKISKHINNILSFQKKKRFFTKLTGPPRIHYLNSIFSDAFFIHVLRDPRAVISSLFKAPFWRQQGGLQTPWWENGLPEEDISDWKKSNRSPAVLAAIQWKRVVELTWEEKKNLQPERFIEVKYEEFVEQPHQVLNHIFNRVGLADSIAANHYLTSLGEVKNMNYKFSHSLKPEEVEEIERVTRKTAQKCGYYL